MNKLTFFYRCCSLVLALSVFAACSKGSDEPDDDQNPNSQQNDIAVLDNAVQAYMTKYNVPGLSLAVSKGEKLVYVKAYGQADKEANQTMTTDHMFRIASISKSVTGIAFMKLIEEGKVKLSDKVFGNGALLGTTYGNNTYSANLQAITVKHLLEHTAGAWGNSVNDPMFLNGNMTADQLISWTLDNRPVQTTPGTKYDYSNFGYCVLGRIVEKVSGKSYEQYVKDAILQPVGITRMTVGGNTLGDRKSGEVKYYGTTAGGNAPYSYNIVRMDAHGGWIASAKDLVRLLVHVDGFNNKKDILSSASLTTMTTAPSLATPSGYGLGWSVNQAKHWWHTGSLPGSVSVWVRGNNGYNWAVLTNTRAGGNEMNELDALVWTAINGNAPWQNIDQF
ncbi:serine hydrolase domain-containing protein [Gynurincola endophyticus]|uniref:serine hydrolase domain-containing protein n=1 Tax=Gynurincola endophyticus TaxID=2479004 RepID=UPI000F8ECECF|nr:serine hydrolase domain-containing protein [Gynurincola endophyticus]